MNDPWCDIPARLASAASALPSRTLCNGLTRWPLRIGLDEIKKKKAEIHHEVHAAEESMVGAAHLRRKIVLE